MDTHRDVYIVLKKSLKWVPIVGWVCENPISFLCSLTPVTERHSVSKKIEDVQLNGANANFTQGMQFYNFIFLARSWASDRRYLVNRLAWLGKRAQEQDIPLTFILYPEGTIVSPNTRPISKRYADKMGIVSVLDDRFMSLVPSDT